MQDASADPLIGTVLADRYRILGLMSQGGFGKVYRAEHVTIGRPLAVKVMAVSGQGLDDDDCRRRFLSEARATSQIRHANVIDIIDFGHTTDGLAFYVMEFLEGEDLAHTLHYGGALPWWRLGPMVLQICGALGAAHRLGIVHRDIKPANCFRIAVEDNQDFIKVLDFGIAKIYAPPPGMDVPRTATHTLMGTPAYMAPEFAAGSPADERSDIYALGVVMYELATGVRPFGGADFVSILFNHRYSEAVPPRSIVADVPEAAERIILRALSKHPDDRYQTMRALQEDVRASLVGSSRPLLTVDRTVVAVRGPRPSPADVPAPETGAHLDDSVSTAVRSPPVPPPTAVTRKSLRGLLVITTLSVATATVVALSIGRSGLFAGSSGDAPAPVAAAASSPEAPMLSAPLPVFSPTDPRALAGTTGESGGLPTKPPAELNPDPPPDRPVQVEPPPAAKPPDVKAAPRKKLPPALPAFNAARAADRLKRAVGPGTEACWTRHKTPSGFEFEVTVAVAADGGVKATGTVNSALRRCLIDLVHPRLSLEATTTGGVFQYTFRRV
jgi:serine/threonine protein kinase